jgi:hypothetical protein
MRPKAKRQILTGRLVRSLTGELTGSVRSTRRISDERLRCQGTFLGTWWSACSNTQPTTGVRCTRPSRGAIGIDITLGSAAADVVPKAKAVAWALGEFEASAVVQQVGPIDAERITAYKRLARLIGRWNAFAVDADAGLTIV